MRTANLRLETFVHECSLAGMLTHKTAGAFDLKSANTVFTLAAVCNVSKSNCLLTVTPFSFKAAESAAIPPASLRIQAEFAFDLTSNTGCFKRFD